MPYLDNYGDTKSKTEVHQINEAQDQSVPKINTVPVLIERKQVDKKTESNIC